MTWFRSFGLGEGILVLVFLLAYGLYLWRIITIARALNSSFGSIFAKLAIRTLFFALLMVAFLGPAIGDSKKEVKSVGKDIMICVDLSKSMDAFDIQPSRLEKVKFEMKRIVDAFSSDRIGIIIFSSEAFMQCPLTYDVNALYLFIETMNTNLVPAAGTDFGPPLRMALKKVNDQEGPSTQQKSKVIILISDGEDFGDDTSDIISEIDDQGIRLFTLGVGTEQGSKLYAGKGYKTDRQGNVVVSRLNASSLQDLARTTGGQYFEINETKNDVSRLINTVSRIEGELRESRFVDASANRYYYFLVAALVLLLMDILINVKTVTI